MFLSADQLKANIDWLLENASPPVRYLTHIHLLRTPLHAEGMAVLWRQVEICPEAEEIFSKQEPDGSWYTGGSWAMQPSYRLKSGWDPYTPKYVTAAWILPLLGEMGFTAQDERVQKACDYVLSNGYFRSPLFQDHEAAGLQSLDVIQAEISPCHFAQYLLALGSVGMAEDRRVRKGFALLLQQQRLDGGWALEKHIRERGWDRSCPFSSYHATMALYRSGDPVYRDALVRGLGYLLWNLSIKTDEELRRFYYHGHSLVHELLMFSEYRVGLQEHSVQVMLDWLAGMYHAGEGCFRYAGKPISQYSQRQDSMDARVAKYRLHHLIEDDWLTYTLTRIGMNLQQAA
jgi:hypothetical protein